MNVLKRLRTERGLSLRVLAAKADLDQSTISLIENDRKRAMLTTLTKLARALEVPLDDLMELQDSGASERGRRGGLVSQAKKETPHTAFQPVGS
jgi:transcriptional regulator with XRE-family HTH domain